MKRKILTALVAIMLMLICCSAFVACSGGNGDGDPSNNETVEITGVQDIHVVAGVINNATLLDGVSVTLGDGTKVAPTLDRSAVGEETAQVNAGMYNVYYSYGNKKVSARLYVYGAIKLYYNDVEVTKDYIDILYSDARDSSNFTRNVVIKDSFGNLLDVSKSQDSASYNQHSGDFKVKYLAQDRAGQNGVFEITWKVKNDDGKEFSISDGAVKYVDDSVTISANFDGVTEGFVEYNGALINPETYDLVENGLVIKGGFYRSLEEGEYTLTFITQYGTDDFKLNVSDDGTPVFSVEDVKDYKLYVGGNGILPAPIKLAPLHKDYIYDLSLTSLGDSYKAVITVDGIKVTTNQDAALPEGKYLLTVTAKNADDNSLTNEKTVEVGVFKANATFIKWSVDGMKKAEINDVLVDGYAMQRYKTDIKESGGYSDLLFIAGSEYHNYKYIATEFCIESNVKKNGTENGNLAFKFFDAGVEPNTDLRPYTAFMKADGTFVSYNELVVGEWYTAYVDMAKMTPATNAASKGKYVICMYPDGGTEVTCSILLRNARFEGEKNLTDNANYLAWGVDGTNKAKITNIIKDGKIIQQYNSLKTESAGYSDLQLTYGAEYADAKYLVTEFYIESNEKENGTINGNLAFKFFDAGVEPNTDLRPYSAFMKADGTFVEYSALAVGEWYTAYVCLDGMAPSQVAASLGKYVLCIYPDGGSWVTSQILFKNTRFEGSKEVLGSNSKMWSVAKTGTYINEYKNGYIEQKYLVEKSDTAEFHQLTFTTNGAGVLTTKIYVNSYTSDHGIRWQIYGSQASHVTDVKVTDGQGNNVPFYKNATAGWLINGSTIEIGQWYTVNITVSQATSLVWRPNLGAVIDYNATLKETVFTAAQ
ncbi:MAG: hypothetical protein IKA11_04825 [Clostridia bacterium]|nr:hypothetical protein [Clostridia bacterium]